jgi:hypothetical protein
MASREGGPRFDRSLRRLVGKVLIVVALMPMLAAWSQQQELVATGDNTLSNFGNSVSLSGDTALVGALREADYGGAAYVFVRTGTVWALQQRLVASDGVVASSFGNSVAVSGDTALVGAKDRNNGEGAVYLFVRSGAAWSLQTTLVPSDGPADRTFGCSVSISGDTALVGKRQDNGEGLVYVFVRSNTVWTEQQKLVASDGAPHDLFGGSVSVSGDTALIGACEHDSGRGAAYVFRRTGGIWTQQQELLASDGSSFEYFGASVSISGETAMVGAYAHDEWRGAAYVFVPDGEVWTEQQTLRASDGASPDAFGISVSVSGDTALVGARNRQTLTGAAYVFVRDGTAWIEQQWLTASDGVSLDQLGQSVSLSGDTALLGAPEKASGTGAAYVFVAGAGIADGGLPDGGRRDASVADGAAADARGADGAPVDATVLDAVLPDHVETQMLERGCSCRMSTRAAPGGFLVSLVLVAAICRARPSGRRATARRQRGPDDQL